MCVTAVPDQIKARMCSRPVIQRRRRAPLDSSPGRPEPGQLLQVLDSPFGRLKDLMVELCEEQRLPIPRAFMRIALSMMRRSVRKRAGFNVDDSMSSRAPSSLLSLVSRHTLITAYATHAIGCCAACPSLELHAMQHTDGVCQTEQSFRDAAVK